MIRFQEFSNRKECRSIKALDHSAEEAISLPLGGAEATDLLNFLMANLPENDDSLQEVMFRLADRLRESSGTSRLDHA